MEKIELSKGVFTVSLQTEDEAIYWGQMFTRPCDLVELHIPEGATAIADHAFKYCNTLKKIYMPKSMKCLGESMLYSVDQTVEIYYQGTSEEFKALAAPRRIIKSVQVPGKYDVQPYCCTEGTYYEDREETVVFDSFCADCRVICADGETLLYGYRRDR